MSALRSLNAGAASGAQETVGHGADHLSEEDLDEVINRGIAENQVTGKSPDLIKIAQKLAKYGASIKERVLKSQVAGAGRKQGAAAEKGGGAIGKAKFKLNPNKPDFLKQVADHAEELLEDEG